MIAIEPAHADEALWEEIPGGVTAPLGFRAAGVHCGIKRARPDLALIVSDGPAAAAGVFTTNRVKAAPVLVSMEHLKSGRCRAVVVASGNANACTGTKGLEDAKTMASVTGEVLGLPPEEVVVASTGVIGVPMPVEKVCAGIRVAASVLDSAGSRAAAEAILTTDRTLKEIAVEGKIGGHRVRIGGIAKGSGMIHPNMATMLAFVTTDAAISAGMLRRAFLRSVERTFNMITVDGDTSTNDMAVALASGLARNPVIVSEGADFDAMVEGLEHVARALARMIVGDGEGATRVVRVEVRGARTEREAQLIARTIASSNLVKTAVFGADPNWGRVLAAAGRAGVEFDPNLVDVTIGDVLVAKNGAALEFDEARAREALASKEVLIAVDLHAGFESSVAYTCDLTYEYVRINASYRS
ncbi:MAG: bifunctional glutamate N-acetyltransferase/amino-acid acetyltransferase ArgJ [Firmicutes bacterium]|jgi:glutamate N-acetyltransferase/amino-acid N-acetyltransferase|nr:bifunctional glutamate N-acetyltransferase/amino-acid acetyltransferase ArgJ [Bacillota bacterium]MDH7495121.1 bifunctional glutamate N-acetyltransferase/amino-acid acetyltransferase ArgJ [Bacillota bacterium]